MDWYNNKNGDLCGTPGTFTLKPLGVLLSAVKAGNSAVYFHHNLEKKESNEQSQTSWSGVVILKPKKFEEGEEELDSGFT